MFKIISIILIVFSSFTQAVEVKNFKSGLACTDGKTFGWICHEAEKIFITGQGKCTYNKQEKPCTWHGFEFDYSTLEDGEEIMCTVQNSYPISLGNPDKETDKDVTESTYKLPLEPGSGHFFNPQYVLLAAPNEPPYSRYEHTACYINDKKLFEFKREYVFPKKP